jgi:hypothetical protein
MRRFAVGLLIALSSTACGEDDAGDTFPCGNGSCQLGGEVCVIGGEDMCSTCVPAPEACDPAACNCLPPATDPAFGAYACLDPGTCEDIEGGAVVTCDEIEWGCG